MYSVCILIDVSMYLCGYPSTNGISRLWLQVVPWGPFDVHLEMTIEWTQRYTQRPWLSKFSDALWGHDWAIWRCTWRPWSSEVGDEHLGRDWVSLEMRAWRPWSCELGGRNRVSLDKYREVHDEREGWCWDSFHQHCNSQPWDCDKVTLPLTSHGELADCDQSCREANRKLKIHSGVNT